MLPNISEGITQNFEYAEYPSKTYCLNLEKDTIMGTVDQQDAVKQAVYLILNTERYEYLIYSWNYGVELENLFGKPIDFALAEIERRISEALLQDTRITAVKEFAFDTWKNVVHCTFRVESIFGEFDAEREVSI